ncbi:MAG: 4-alpha-glucanotransferase [Spirochaetia bacterium]|nr:4-alpha-glucanotransferase [Spirochaetia bacterium]
MKSQKIDRYLNGLSVPVFSLKSRESCGIGEFLDIIYLGDFCKKAGFEMIQILPVNDTGFDNSPYGALSAFALNPVYLRLQALTKNNDDLKKIEKFKQEYENKARVHYTDVYRFKNNILHEIYIRDYNDIINNKEIKNRFENSKWLKIYSVYRYLKEKNGLKSWVDWPNQYREPDKGLIDKILNENFKEIYYYIWRQYETEKQLLKVYEYLDKNNILLKGDIPILMNKDSADVWYNRNYFNFEFTAGAPPDYFSKEGQNWGFPVYNWNKISDENYEWWVERLKQSGRFFHAIRLDHVIGFLRIWQIPENDISARCGRFNPSAPIFRKDLQEKNISEEEISLLSTPAIHKNDVFLAEEKIKKYFDCHRETDWMILKNEFRGEKKIYGLDENEDIKNFLISVYRNKTLQETDDDSFSPLWFFHEAGFFNSLSEEKKNVLREAIAGFYKESEAIWEKNGRKILSNFKENSDLIFCAEDLGAVPQCTAKILEELNIFSLKVIRWTKHYDRKDAPFFEKDEFPFLSVVTTSVHDSSNVRQWWREEENERRFFYVHIHPRQNDDFEFTPEIASDIIKWQLETKSLISILTIQDIFALDKKYWSEDCRDERINIPGTVSDFNWSYRIKAPLEELAKDESFLETIKGLNSIRKNKS